MSAVLINPVTGETLRLSPARPPGERSPGRNSWKALTRSGIPGPLVSALLAAYGWPRESLGEGSFAHVALDPSDGRKVIKFTYDEMDGTTAAYVKERQKEGALDGLVKIYNVLFMPFRSTESGDDDRIWIIRAKRVTMLVHAADDSEEFLNAARKINAAFNRHLREVQNEVIGFMHETGMKGYSKVPPALRTRMLATLRRFASALESEGVQAPLRAVRQLIKEKLPITDLAPRNWGVDEQGMVITDFGLSSLNIPALQKAKAATGTVIPPAPKRRERVPEGQLTLFNPLPYKVAWKVGHQWNANAFSSLREAKDFFERVRRWPNSSHHQIVDARSGAVLVAANPAYHVPGLGAEEAWWVLPGGEVMPVEYDEFSGHLGFVFQNLEAFGLEEGSLKGLGDSGQVLELVAKKGAIRILATADPKRAGRVAIGADMDTTRLGNYRKLKKALREIGFDPGLRLYVHDPISEKEGVTTVGKFTGAGQ